jgi:hypothetical protein
MLNFHNWVNVNKLNWDSLSENPNAINILKENKNKINWYKLALNPNAIELFDEIDWERAHSISILSSIVLENYKILNNISELNQNLSKNPNAINFLKKNKMMICWMSLHCNPNALELLNDYKVEKKYNNFLWPLLSVNSNAIELLKENQDKINWNSLSKNPNAIELLKENQDKINWNLLSKNPNAIELLKENQNKINWILLSKNPNIITYDYKKIKENMKKSGIYEELMTYTSKN